MSQYDLKDIEKKLKAASNALGGALDSLGGVEGLLKDAYKNVKKEDISKEQLEAIKKQVEKDIPNEIKKVYDKDEIVKDKHDKIIR